MTVKPHFSMTSDSRLFFFCIFFPFTSILINLPKTTNCQMQLDGGNDDLNIGGVAAATEHMTLSGGEAQTMSFDD